MADRSPKRLTREEVEGLLTRLEKDMLRRECLSCECFQGLLAQLALDAADDARPLVAGHRMSPEKTRHSLGCEPCTPADVFAEYLLRRREP